MVLFGSCSRWRRARCVPQTRPPRWQQMVGDSGVWANRRVVEDGSDSLWCRFFCELVSFLVALMKWAHCCSVSSLLCSLFIPISVLLFYLFIPPTLSSRVSTHHTLFCPPTLCPLVLYFIMGLILLLLRLHHFNPCDEHMKPFNLGPICMSALPYIPTPSPISNQNKKKILSSPPSSLLQSSSLRGWRWKTSATRRWRSPTLDWPVSGTAPPRWALPAPTPGWLLKSFARLRSPRVAIFGGGQRSQRMKHWPSLALEPKQNL